MKRCFYFSIVLLLAVGAFLQSARAGDKIDDLKKQLPSLLADSKSNTNAGKEFYLTFLSAWPLVGDKNNVKVYISSGVATDVIIEVKSDGFYKKIKTIPNDIVEVIIPPITAQPFFKTDTQPCPADGIYSGKAVHVVSKAPIICYGITRYQYTSDGFLGIPVSGLGKEYIMASYADVADNGTGAGQYLPSQVGIVAAYDNTKVSFTLGGNLVTKTGGDGRGLNGLTPGKSKSWNLMKGDVLSISSFGNEADLSGSKIVATRPVSVISGNYCAYIPTDTPACDFIDEQELPTNTWGTAYHVTQIFGRLKNSLIKIFAKLPNTKIYRDGQTIGTIPQAGGITNYGFLERRVSDAAVGNFIISSDPGHPISVTQFNPGQNDDNVPSDPFQLILTPIEQFQTEITFNTPGTGNGNGFTTNYINLVYELNTDTPTPTIPDDLEFATVKGGQFTWKPVKQIFTPFIGYKFPAPINGITYAMKTIQLPTDGVYKIRCSRPFAAYAYGFSSYDSYGFPTAVAVGDLSTPDKDSPKPTYTLNCDGSIENGFVEDMPKDPAIRSNLAQILLDDEKSYNYALDFDEFVAGESITDKWRLHVVDPIKGARALIRFIDRAGNTKDTLITYAPFNVSILDNPTDFGSVKLMSPAVTRTVTVQNNSIEDSVTIKKLFLKSGMTGFAFNPPVDFSTTPLVLAKKGEPNDSKKFTVTFTATTTNPGGKPFLDSVIAADDCRQSANLVTAKVGEPQITVEDYDFGAHPLNSSTPRTLKITNPGTAELRVSGITSGPTDPVYTLTPLDFSTLTLAPGETKTFEVIFKPTAVQPYPDQIVFTSDATGPDNISVLNGAGIDSKLQTKGGDYSRRRIQGGDYGGPYIGQQVSIENTGTDEAQIIKVYLEPSADNIQFDSQALAGVADGFNLKSGTGPQTIPINFIPNKTGDYTIQVNFVAKSSKGGYDTLFAKVTGTGIRTDAKVGDLTFAPMLVNSSALPPQTIHFEALNGDVYADDLRIDDLVFDNSSIQPNEYTYTYPNGTPVKSTDFPIVVQKGNTLDLNVIFQAKAVGDRTATLTLKGNLTDKQAQVVSHWTGKGFELTNSFIEGTGGDAGIICLGQQGTIDKAFVTNNSDVDITVSNISLSGAPEFTNLSSSDITITNPFSSFVLQAHQTVKFRVTYSPSAVRTDNAEIIIASDAKNNTDLHLPIKGSGQHFDAAFTLTEQKKHLLTPGERLPVDVVVTQAISDATAGFQTVHATISYDGTVIYTDVKAPVSAAAGYSVTNIVIAPEKIDFDITANTPGALPTQTLATVNFNVYLGVAKKTDILLEVGSQNTCIAVTGGKETIEVGNVCGLDGRAVIKRSGASYYITAPEPNPVHASTQVDFAVGTETQTSIILYNSLGEPVRTLVNQVLKPGAYGLTITTTDLPSGVYYYKMVAGSYKTTQSLMIAK